MFVRPPRSATQSLSQPAARSEPTRSKAPGGFTDTPPCAPCALHPRVVPVQCRSHDCLPAYVLRELSIGAVALGVTFALAGVGALLGSTASETLSRRCGISGTVVGSRILEGCGLAVVTAEGGTDGIAAVLVAGAGQFLYGLGMGAEGPIEISYRQAVTPDRLQGRMNGTMRSLNRAAVVAGAPLGGLFADTVGVLPALWLGSAGLAGSGILLGLSSFRAASYHENRGPD